MPQTFKFEIPKDVKSDNNGFYSLIEFYELTKELFLDQITIDFNKNHWFDANLLAILGAILSNLQEKLNTIKIINLNQITEKAFSKNLFLSNFGGYTIDDFYHTTVKYKKFKSSEEKLFKYYLDNELLSKNELPQMTLGLKKKINESIFEIFNNAIFHGQSDSIFSCGQYYPQKNKLDFTLVDLGNTIKSNVNKYLKEDLNSSDAINWAVQEGHTTKTGDTPGGLGLSLIREFLKLNNGKIQLISSDGYWEQSGENINKSNFNKEFGGTIVNLEFNLTDKNAYCLTSELNPKDIF
jgi:hypothetical protein